MQTIEPYVTLLEAETYFADSRLNAEAWENSSAESQLKALKAATKAINKLAFSGRQTYPGTGNEFPRNGCVTVPAAIQEACCELALTLLDGVDPDLEEENLGVLADVYAGVRTNSNPDIWKDHIKAGIPSAQAWKCLLPFLNDPRAVVIRRG